MVGGRGGERIRKRTEETPRSPSPSGIRVSGRERQRERLKKDGCRLF